MADFSFNTGSDGGATGSGSSAGEGGGGPGAGGVGEPLGGGGSPVGSATDPSTATSATDGAIPIKRRRGRPPGSRTGAKAADAGTGPSPANTGGKEGLDLTFKKNDVAKVTQNIAGLHMMAAILTKQPIMQLTEQEAKALAKSVCDVADYHKISLDGAGGPFALYAALATTVYGIYVPRIVMLKSLKQGEQVVGVAPASPGEAKAQAQQGQGGYDFSGDIASTVQ